jgi:hypothetical protein
MKLTDRTRAVPGDDNVVTCETGRHHGRGARAVHRRAPHPAAMIEAAWQDRPDAAKTAEES